MSEAEKSWNSYVEMARTLGDVGRFTLSSAEILYAAGQLSAERDKVERLTKLKEAYPTTENRVAALQGLFGAIDALKEKGG